MAVFLVLAAAVVAGLSAWAVLSLRHTYSGFDEDATRDAISEKAIKQLDKDDARFREYVQSDQYRKAKEAAAQGKPIDTSGMPQELQTFLGVASGTKDPNPKTKVEGTPRQNPAPRQP